MRTITVRLPEALANDIEAESRERQVSKSDVVRERLQGTHASTRPAAHLDAIADLIGAVEDLPAELSVRTDDYLRATGYGRSDR